MPKKKAGTASKPAPETPPIGPPPGPEAEPMDTATDAPLAPEELRSEMEGRVAARVAVPTVPEAIVRPKIVSGKCEFDGQPYTECQHYAGMQVFCSYCGAEGEIFESRTVNVFSLPDRPNEYIFVCSDFTCQDKHRKKFTQGA